VSRVIIILGSPNDNRGRLSATALSRLDRALAEYRKRPEAAVLLTGGFGPHFNTSPRPHADYAREYLLGQGVPEAAFLEPVLSSNTVEDAVLSKRILSGGNFDHALVVTSDYHIDRAEFIFSRFLPDLEIGYCPARAPQTEAERAACLEHERRALEELGEKGIWWEGKCLY